MSDHKIRNRKGPLGRRDWQALYAAEKELSRICAKVKAQGYASLDSREASLFDRPHMVEWALPDIAPTGRNSLPTTTPRCQLDSDSMASPEECKE